MDNNALVAALGPQANRAVRGYRMSVVAEGAARGLRMVDAPGSSHTPADPMNIRLRITASPRQQHRHDRLRWSPATGWSFTASDDEAVACYYAGPGATPIDMVPEPSEVADWAAALDRPGAAAQPPPRVELDDEPRAIRRLMAFCELHPEPDTPPWRPLHVRTVLHGTVPALLPVGALDAFTAPALADQLRTWVPRSRHVVLDLSRITFLGAAGIHTFLAAHQLARGRSGTLHITGADHPAVQRVLSLTRADKVLSIHREPTPRLAARLAFAWARSKRGT